MPVQRQQWLDTEGDEESRMKDDKFKVLMVDDEKDILDFFTKAFQGFSHIDFLASTSAQKGVEIAKAERPEVVLMDLRMPGMNGEEALRELKSLLPKTKFIIMTGWEDGETRERLENEIGVAAYYTKPVDLEQVVTKVMNLIMVRE